MAQPAARLRDPVAGIDQHVVANPSGATATVPLPFSGSIDGGCEDSVLVNGTPVAVDGATVRHTPPGHLPPPSTTFVTPPRNNGTVRAGSRTVLAGGRPVARVGDGVATCTDIPTPNPTSRITSGSPQVVVG